MYRQIQARLGEVLYRSANSSSDVSDASTIAEAMRHFCRSIELCDGYLRGYYGLKLVGQRFEDASEQSRM